MAEIQISNQDPLETLNSRNRSAEDMNMPQIKMIKIKDAEMNIAELNIDSAYGSLAGSKNLYGSSNNSGANKSQNSRSSLNKSLNSRSSLSSTVGENAKAETKTEQKTADSSNVVDDTGKIKVPENIVRRPSKFVIPATPQIIIENVESQENKTTVNAEVNKENDEKKESMISPLENLKLSCFNKALNYIQQIKTRLSEEGIKLPQITNNYARLAETQTKPIPRGCYIVMGLEDGTLHDASAAITSLLGYQKETLIGEAFVNFVYPKDTVVLSSKMINGLNRFFDKKSRGNLDTTFFCRLRVIRDFYNLAARSVKSAEIYKPFKIILNMPNSPNVKYFTKSFRDLSLVVAELVPLKSAYEREVKNKNFSDGCFSTRHSSTCLFSDCDPASIPYLGHLPQDLTGSSIFDFYHPEDMNKLKNIYEQVVKHQGEPYSSGSLRFRTFNNSWITLVTEWLCFVNPWTKGIDSIVGQHRVSQAPEDTDIFNVNTVNSPPILSHQLFLEVQAARKDILSILSKPFEAPYQLPLKRKRSAILLAEETPINEKRKRTEIKISQPNTRLEITQTQRQACNPEMPSTSGVNTTSKATQNVPQDTNVNNSTRDSSVETPSSYGQLNYTATLERYFSSKPFMKTSSEEDGESKIETSNQESSFGFTSSNTDSQNIFCNTCSGSGECDNNVSVNSYRKNANNKTDQRNERKTSQKYVRSFPLTEANISLHNQYMQKQFVKTHREKQSPIKLLDKMARKRSSGNRNKGNANSRKKCPKKSSIISKRRRSGRSSNLKHQMNNCKEKEYSFLKPTTTMEQTQANSYARSLNALGLVTTGYNWYMPQTYPNSPFMPLTPRAPYYGQDSMSKNSFPNSNDVYQANTPNFIMSQPAYVVQNASPAHCINNARGHMYPPNSGFAPQNATKTLFTGHLSGISDSHMMHHDNVSEPQMIRHHDSHMTQISRNGVNISGTRVRRGSISEPHTHMYNAGLHESHIGHDTSLQDSQNMRQTSNILQGVNMRQSSNELRNSLHAGGIPALHRQTGIITDPQIMSHGGNIPNSQMFRHDVNITVPRILSQAGNIPEHRILSHAGNIPVPRNLGNVANVPLSHAGSMRELQILRHAAIPESQIFNNAASVISNSRIMRNDVLPQPQIMRNAIIPEIIRNSAIPKPQIMDTAEISESRIIRPTNDIGLEIRRQNTIPEPQIMRHTIPQTQIMRHNIMPQPAVINQPIPEPQIIRRANIPEEVGHQLDHPESTAMRHRTGIIESQVMREQFLRHKNTGPQIISQPTEIMDSQMIHNRSIVNSHMMPEIPGPQLLRQANTGESLMQFSSITKTHITGHTSTTKPETLNRGVFSKQQMVNRPCLLPQSQIMGRHVFKEPEVLTPHDSLEVPENQELRHIAPKVHKKMTLPDNILKDGKIIETDKMGEAESQATSVKAQPGSMNPESVRSVCTGISYIVQVPESIHSLENFVKADTQDRATLNISPSSRASCASIRVETETFNEDSMRKSPDHFEDKTFNFSDMISSVGSCHTNQDKCCDLKRQKALWDLQSFKNLETDRKTAFEPKNMAPDISELLKTNIRLGTSENSEKEIYNVAGEDISLPFDNDIMNIECV